MARMRCISVDCACCDVGGNDGGSVVALVHSNIVACSMQMTVDVCRVASSPTQTVLQCLRLFFCKLALQLLICWSFNTRLCCCVVIPKTKILDSLHMNVAVVFAASLKPANALCPPVVVLPSRFFFSFCVSISLRAACVYDDGIYWTWLAFQIQFKYNWQINSQTNVVYGDNKAMRTQQRLRWSVGGCATLLLCMPVTK